MNETSSKRLLFHNAMPLFYAGPIGWRHFALLLNALLSEICNTTIEEVNTAYACVLFKGHGKDKTLAKS